MYCLEYGNYLVGMACFFIILAFTETNDKCKLNLEKKYVWIYAVLSIDICNITYKLSERNSWECSTQCIHILDAGSIMPDELQFNDP